MDGLVIWLAKFFGHIDISGVEAFAVQAFRAIFVLLLGFLLARMARQFVVKRMTIDGISDDDATKTYKKLASVCILLPTILFAIHVLGFSLGPVFATSGFLAMAFAFAVRNIADNYVSGVLVRLERSIRPGDIVEIEGEVLTVDTIGLRATTMHSFGGKDILLPNTDLIQKKIANYTLSDSECRIKTDFRVNYSSDFRKIRRVVEKLLQNFEGRSDKVKPVLLLAAFEEKFVRYTVYVWIENAMEVLSQENALNELIWERLNKEGISFSEPTIRIQTNEDRS